MKTTRQITAILFLLSMVAIGQNKTISGKEKTEREVTASHKVMLVPFEPKLYLSEVDHNLHFETKLSPRQIRNKFRDGLNEQLYKTFKNQRYTVVDLMEDTLKYKKDTENLYQFLVYDYLKTPDQEHFKPPVKEKEDRKIDKGQLTVETNSDRRFMHARVTDPRVMPSLYGKYHTDVFVLISQLDIKASGGPDNNTAGSPARKIVVHYTVYTSNGKEINSGIAEESFDPGLNNPGKIIDRHFSKIALTIAQRVHKALATPPTKGNG